MIDNSGNLSEDFLESLKGLDQEADAGDILRSALKTIDVKHADARSIQKVLELVRHIEEMESRVGTAKWFVDPYGIETLPKHAKFFEASKDYNEVLFLAANRVGKSVAGAYALSCHLTGLYPSWWNGRVFDTPIQAWAVGKDARAVRDTLQTELLGKPGEWGTGMIPAHCLGKSSALQGVPQAIDFIKIKHVPTGRWSDLGFKNYQQDIGSFMGTTRHVVLGDEEMPLAIYNECNIRTATVDGLMLLTFTPLDGLTPLIVNFCKNADYLVGTKPIIAVDQEDDDLEQTVGRDRSKAVIQAGWDDVPWLSEKVKARLLEDTPEYLRDARSKGTPSVGAGNVYTTPIERILVEPFAIPDSWPRMYGFDVGWNKTAAIWVALDPATDTLYVYDEHYMGKELPSTHAYGVRSRGEWIPGAIDPAANGRGQADGRKLIKEYKDLGLILFEANNEVEAGVLAISQRAAVGKLKIFKTCVNIQKEWMLYGRDKHGKIIKENDHALDALRYVLNNMIRMTSKADNRSTRGVTYSARRYDI